MTTPSNPAPSETPIIHDGERSDHQPKHCTEVIDTLRQQVEELTREKKEWRCSALLYHSELRDLAEGRKVETQLGFNVETVMKAERTARLAAEAAVEQLRRDGERLDWMESHNIRITKPDDCPPWIGAISASGDRIRTTIDVAMSTPPNQEEAQ